MKENFKMIRDMEEELFNLPLVILMTENGKMTRKVDKENLLG